GSFEQLAGTTVWQNRDGFEDISHLIDTHPSVALEDPALAHVSPALRDAFVSGYAGIHEAERTRTPTELRHLHNGHESSHHFLEDNCVLAGATGAPTPVTAWQPARSTLPGFTAHESARRGGERLSIPVMGDPDVG